MTDVSSDKEPYWTALGRFACEFAQTEDSVIVLFLNIIRVKDDLCYPLYSGLRARDAISYIRRIFKARDIQMPDHLETAFSQIVFINTVRDILFHYGISFPQNSGAKAHAKRARNVVYGDETHVIHVTPDILHDICYDLETCRYRMFVTLDCPELSPLYSLLPQCADRALQPWKCKSSALENVRLRFRSTDEERVSRPLSLQDWLYT